MTAAVSILLVDDHPVVREGYRRLLERQPGYSVCAEADDAPGAYAAYCEHAPDVVVMDMLLPGASGLDALRHIRQRDAEARVLIVTMHAGASLALKALEAGAWGYVTKSSGPRELVRAVAAVAAGQRALSEDTAQAIAADRLADPMALLEELGARETEILRMLASGCTIDAIAAALNLSEKTVRNYHYGIKNKTGAQTDAQLVWLALSVGLVQVDDLRAALPFPVPTLRMAD
ncbi:MAG TPA: response regulator transcription factor [Methylibium sp.]|uniref:response regulator transcription factor n=1 Tax=Methylibium sp. TaxID=2067992 RepID=UPI002DBEC101|nr:response regulator transcription factor [Methylibium sp.]HEU4460509.1 response regulator transcription factor [Methylibium sp.]